MADWASKWLGGSPLQGVDEFLWLTAFLDRRRWVLQVRGARAAASRTSCKGGRVVEALQRWPAALGCAATAELPLRSDPCASPTLCHRTPTARGRRARNGWTFTNGS